MIRRYALGAGLAALVVLLDVITKRWASIELVDSDIVIIPNFLVLTYTENPGAAFSMFENAGPFFGIAAITVSAALLWSLRLERPWMETAAYGLIIGGGAWESRRQGVSWAWSARWEGHRLDRSLVDPDFQRGRHVDHDRGRAATDTRVADTVDLEVPERLEGQRVDKVLADLLHSSRAQARALLDAGVPPRRRSGPAQRPGSHRGGGRVPCA